MAKTKGDLYKELGDLENIKFMDFGIDRAGNKRLNKDIKELKEVIKKMGEKQVLGWRENEKKKELS